MIILGIDPGYAIVGCGLVKSERGKLAQISSGAITTPAGMPFSQRLRVIRDDLSALLDRWKPDAASIEELFFTTNKRTAIAVAQARGVILLALEEHGIPVFEYTPLQVKQAVVGYGEAEKFQVMDMTRRLLSLPALPKPDDVADALAIAICHAHCAGAGPRASLLLQR